MLRAAVSGRHALALTGVAEGGATSYNAVLTPSIGEVTMELGRCGVDFVAGPAVHVSMTGTTLQHVEVAHFLINQGADPTRNSAEVSSSFEFAPALMYTVGYQVQANSTRAAMLQKLIIAFPLKFNMSRIRTWALQTGNSLPLHCAVEANFFDGVYTLVTMSTLVPRFEYDKNEKDENGQTALMVAAASGAASLVKLMIHNNCKISLYDNDRRTVLHHAAMAGHLDVIDAILTARKELETLRRLLQWKDKDGKTALELVSLVPVRLQAVRKMRSMMTPLGVVPTSTPWLTKPKIDPVYLTRNITQYLHQYLECSKGSLGSSDVLGSISTWLRILNNTTPASDVDCIFQSLWNAKALLLIHGSYISPKRPFLAITSQHIQSPVNAECSLTNSMASIVSEMFGDALESLDSDVISLSGSFCLIDHTSSCSLREVLEGEFFGTFLARIQGIVDSSGHTRDISINPAKVAESIFPLRMENAMDELSSLNLVSIHLMSSLSVEWCLKRISHSSRKVNVLVGSAGAVSSGVVPLYSHLTAATLSGVRKWFIFPPYVNATHITEALTKASLLVGPVRLSEYFVASVVAELKLQHDVFETVQFEEDIVYLPSRWSYVTVTMMPSISVHSLSCVLDEKKPNCESPSVIRPVSY